MKKQSEENPPPDPADLAGWRQVIADGRLNLVRPEALVAVLQDLGPDVDSGVRERIAKRLSNALTNMLRGYIGANHPNGGEDIIDRVHTEMFIALLDKESADGRALREAFWPRVEFRAKDALAKEYRHSRIPLAPKVRELKKGEVDEDVEVDSDKAAEINNLLERVEPTGDLEDASGAVGEDVISATANRDLALLDGVRDADQRIDVERAISKIKDFRKRLAFRLYMDGIPFKSKKTESIAKTVGVSDKTAEHWIEELKKLLEATEEVQELTGKKMGERK